MRAFGSQFARAPSSPSAVPGSGNDPSAVSAVSEAQGVSERPAGSRTMRIVIDSRSRDLTAYPSPSSYEVRLNSDIFNVTSMQLTVADVPFPAYLIGASRRVLPLRLLPGGAAGPAVSAPAELTVGDYASAAELAAELKVALTAAAAAAGVAGASFEVSHSPRTDSLTITSSVPFVLPLQGQAASSPAQVLGFGCNCDYESQPDPGGNVLVAPFRCNMTPDRYIVMSLSPNAELLTSTTQAIDRSFALIPITPMLSINNDDESYMKRWNPPLARVARIHLEFTNADGSPYDFQNQDHRVELVFEVNIHRMG